MAGCLWQDLKKIFGTCILASKKSHKKGDKSELTNYRPVSCLPAASKLLELVVNKQTSQFMEENNLIPSSQHGFRARRSTLTALLLLFFSPCCPNWTQACSHIICKIPGPFGSLFAIALTHYLEWLIKRLGKGY